MYQSTVQKGQQLGRTIGFPTLNLNPKTLPASQEPGVYQATIIWKNQTYQGALFFGPKKTFNQVETVLEIFVFDFDQEIYGQEVKFTLGKFIRPPIKFDSLNALKNQLADDVEAILRLPKS